jgi:predicted transcriptional regulator
VGRVKQRTKAAETPAERAVRNAIASVRAEGLDVSEEVRADLDAAARDEMSPDDVVSRAVERARRTRTRAAT